MSTVEDDRHGHVPHETEPLIDRDATEDRNQYV